MRPASSSWSMAGGRRVLNIDYSSPIPAGLLHCKLDQGGATKQKGKKTTVLYPINEEHGSSSSSSFACMYNNDERQKQLMEEELESLEELGEYEREKEEEGDQGIVGRRRRRMMMVMMPMNERGEEEEEDEEEEEEGLKGVSKKRRLSGDQVRWLEQSFERESKLEVQRKEELARELGLRPRQVAVWFQNRRARCKTKRVEKEYNFLKHQYDSVLQERNRLQGEVSRLKELLGFHDEGMQGKGGDSSSHANIIALGGLGNNSTDNGKEEEEEEEEQQQQQKGRGGGGGENKYRAMEVVEVRNQREGNTNNSSCISTEQSEVVDTESSLENALIDPQKGKENQSPGPPTHDCMQFNLPPYCTSVVKLEDCYITENWHNTSSYLFNLDDHTLFEDWHNVDSSTHSKPLWNPYL